MVGVACTACPQSWMISQATNPWSRGLAASGNSTKQLKYPLRQTEGFRAFDDHTLYISQHLYNVLITATGRYGILGAFTSIYSVYQFQSRLFGRWYRDMVLCDIQNLISLVLLQEYEKRHVNCPNIYSSILYTYIQLHPKRWKNFGTGTATQKTLVLPIVYNIIIVRHGGPM